MDESILNEHISSIMTPTAISELFVFEDYTQRLIIASILSVVTIVGIVGNGHVILAVLFSRKLRSSTNWFVVNLGFTDLVTCLFQPFNVVAMVSKDGWPIANWTCTMTGATVFTCQGSSIITLALIAYNRWVLLTRPRARFDRIYTRRNILLMIAFSWLYPFLLVIVPHFAGLGRLGYSSNYKICQHDTTLPTSDYYSLLAGACVIIPVFIFIVVIYVFIYRFVKKHNRSMQNTMKNSNRLREDTTSNENTLNISATHYDPHEDQINGENSYLSRIESQEQRQHGNVSVISSSFSINVGPQTRSQDTCSHVEACRPSTDSRAHDNPTVAVDEGVADLSSTREDIQTENHHQKNDLDQTLCHSDIDVELAEHRSVNLASEISPAGNTPKTSANSRASGGVEQKVSRQNISVTKSLSLVVVVFFVCYIPFGICVVTPNSDPAVPWANLLLIINSCLNPLVYAWTMPVFRQVMGCIARCRYRHIPERIDFLRYCCRK